MTYELLTTGRGVMTDRTPVFWDVKGSAELSFLLPDAGQYVAVFIDETGFCTQVQIRAGVVELPRELLKPQVLQLYVIKIAEDGLVEQPFACEPLRINSLADARANVFELTGAATEDDLRERMAEIEIAFCTQGQEFEKLSREYHLAIANFNAAVKVLNDVNDRLDALEKNYDPTIIE